MSAISSLLDELYRKDRVTTSLEKTAEDNLHAALLGSNQVSENPYADMSTEDLAKLALQLSGGEKTAAAKETPVEPEAEVEVSAETAEVLEKTAEAVIGGQVMAHAAVHEFGLIKEAMAHGLCRVCKENPMDIQGASICSACSAE